MALSGLDIYKLLPKTNCKECGFPTCLALAMQIAKKAASVDKCPYAGEETKRILEEAGRPPIKLVTVGTQEGRFEVGQETVMFRHEEKFHRPCALGFIVDDNLESDSIRRVISTINTFHFERVGQQLGVNLVAIRNVSTPQRFAEVVKTAAASTTLALMLMSDDPGALEAALLVSAATRPLVYRVTPHNCAQLAPILKKFSVPVVVSAATLDELASLTETLTKEGIPELVLDTGDKEPARKLWDLTQLRRQALRKANRALGYPALAVTRPGDDFDQALEAATYMAKYAGVILVRSVDAALALSLLTLRQNIYTDPQKPLQIEPKLYSVGKTTPASPLLVTTNFSLTYYTVLGEVEASKVPAHILTVDTEGMSVLTAWSAEKFNAEIICEAMKKYEVEKSVADKRLVIPGYVAMLSGDLQEQTGWDIVVGPKEAAGIPSFLKNLD